MANEFLSVAEAASRLGVSTRTVTRMLDKGVLVGYVLPSGYRRIDAQSVKALLSPPPEKVQK